MNEETFQLTTGNEQVEGSVQVAADGLSAIFVPTEQLGGATEYQVTLFGNEILTLDGRRLDANNDGEAGDILFTGFRTVSLSSIEGTNVFGFLFDSNRVGPNGEDIPITGARINVIGMPDLSLIHI